MTDTMTGIMRDALTVVLLGAALLGDAVALGRAAAADVQPDPAVVAVETRRAIEHLQPQPVAGPVERVPDLSVYDQLLTIQPDQKANPE